MKFSATIVTTLVVLLLSVMPVTAAEGQVLGVHILRPDELGRAKELLSVTPDDNQWHYVTIPLSLQDLENPVQWQHFFTQARDNKVIPIVRLVSEFNAQAGVWQIPTRKNIVDQFTFLSALEWPTPNKHVIIFNEVNHAGEWGGQLDPTTYARTLRFASNWARSEQKNYVVLPAALDLAAPNSRQTMEAFSYLSEMLQADPEILQTVDAWNSHSYPNPGFSSSPQRTAQNSLRGFQHELLFVKRHLDRDLPVFITETGWVANAATLPWLEQYYLYALQHIWSNPQVVAVTPFVLQGSPGPFSGFSFLDEHNQPTAHYIALQNALTTYKLQQL